MLLTNTESEMLSVAGHPDARLVGLPRVQGSLLLASEVRNTAAPANTWTPSVSASLYFNAQTQPWIMYRTELSSLGVHHDGTADDDVARAAVFVDRPSVATYRATTSTVSFYH